MWPRTPPGMAMAAVHTYTRCMHTQKRGRDVWTPPSIRSCGMCNNEPIPNVARGPRQQDLDADRRRMLPSTAPIIRASGPRVITRRSGTGKEGAMLIQMQHGHLHVPISLSSHPFWLGWRYCSRRSSTGPSAGGRGRVRTSSSHRQTGLGHKEGSLSWSTQLFFTQALRLPARLWVTAQRRRGGGGEG